MKALRAIAVVGAGLLLGGGLGLVTCTTPITPEDPRSPLSTQMVGAGVQAAATTITGLFGGLGGALLGALGGFVVVLVLERRPRRARWEELAADDNDTPHHAEN